MRRQATVVLLTADEGRHRYVAGVLARQLNLVGVVSEGKIAAVVEPSQYTAEDQQVLDRHFAERNAAEQRLLGKNPHFPDTELLNISNGQVNSQSTFEWIARLNPDVIALYGTGLIKPPLLDTYANRIINLHLGLSPYYRGTATNFFPLVYNEPECVGATIHVAVAAVDAGSMLTQVRPEAEVTDRAHELGTKTIMAGASAMAEAIQAYQEGSVVLHKQDLSVGRVFKRKDFNPDLVRTVWRNFDQGMMREYLAGYEARRARFPIVTLSRGIR